jgi:hypothetical protein
MKAYKYQVGDRVVLRPDKQICNPGFDISILKGTDRVVEICCVIERGYKAEFPNGKVWHICDNWILGPAFEWGEEIEVSDDGIVWERDKFCAYRPGSPNEIATLNAVYKHARKIKPKEKYIVCITKCNHCDTLGSGAIVVTEDKVEQIKKILGNEKK